MIILTSVGFDLYRMLMIRALIHTDLPEPVAPAISACGISPISEIMDFPPISLPTVNARLLLKFLNSSVSIRSPKSTAALSLLGTSIPTAALPGMGASILISGAASASLISSLSDVMVFTFTPWSGKSSYLVTVGPTLASVTFTPTPKLSNVD